MQEGAGLRVQWRRQLLTMVGGVDLRASAQAVVHDLLTTNA